MRSSTVVAAIANIAAALLLGAWPLPAQSAAPGTAPSTAPAATTSRAANARAANAAATSPTFTTAVANDLLFQLAEGMESRNARMSLGAFDAAKLAGYNRFADQMNAWFREYTSFRVYYKLKQTLTEGGTEGGRGVAIVDFEYEATPSADGSSPVRRHEQMRFSFERGAKGWKIVEFSPRNLFS
ncbi:MAG: hypothetical protein M3P27_11755 [Acidobacteriota bacterium]|nr:hypothetical protein [Acidobacteriota bacterium]